MCFAAFGGEVSCQAAGCIPLLWQQLWFLAEHNLKCRHPKTISRVVDLRLRRTNACDDVLAPALCKHHSQRVGPCYSPASRAGRQRRYVALWPVQAQHKEDSCWEEEQCGSHAWGHVIRARGSNSGKESTRKNTGLGTAVRHASSVEVPAEPAALLRFAPQQQAASWLATAAITGRQDLQLPPSRCSCRLPGAAITCCCWAPGQQRRCPAAGRWGQTRAVHRGPAMYDQCNAHTLSNGESVSLT